MRKKFKVIGMLCLALVLALGAGSAEAGLTICNKSDEQVSISVGYYTGEEWVSEGWWNPDPGKCSTVIQRNLRNTHYYVHATSSSYTWGDDYSFCVNSEKYTIYGDKNCAGRGYRRADFFEIKVGNRLDWTQNLTVAGGPSGSLSSKLQGTWRNSDTSVRFSSNGRIVIDDGTERLSGRYVLSGNAIEIEFSQGGVKLGMEGTVRISGDRLTLSVPEMGTETYVRAR